MSATAKRQILPTGHFSRIYRIIGRIAHARGLPNTDASGKSDPFVVLKGIRSNNHMVNIHVTRCVQNSLAPVWEEEFDFCIPAEWGLVELVGLKAMVFDADDLSVSFLGTEDFLGGCDIDLSMAVTGRAMTHELELAGVPLSKAKGKKPRLTVVVTVYKEVVPKPKPGMELLLDSMVYLDYVREVAVKVSSAKALPNADLVGSSDPQCVVRVILLSGEVREIHRTKVVQDDLNPHWDEMCGAKFELLEQPILMVFDIWDVDGGGRAEDGQHLGTAVLPLMECLPGVPRRRKLPLVGESQLHERKLTRMGVSHEVEDGRDPEKFSETSLEPEPPKPKASCMERLTKAAIDLRERVKSAYYLKKIEKSMLIVEVRTRARQEPMPLLQFLEKATYIADEDDVERVMKLEDWEKAVFPAPTELTTRGRPPRGELFGKEQIVFIHGVVIGACGLPSADENSLSDPYCIVEGMSRTAERIFLHRTRVVPKSLCPQWDETFYLACPPNFELSRVLFSVYDRDETMIAMMGGGIDPLDQDEFLGRASVDISYLQNGDTLVEDVPVSGSVIGNKVKTTAGFRRVPTIAVQIGIQRRVKPLYGVAPEDHSAVIPRRTHRVSRQPANFAFNDTSQFVDEVPVVERTATQVMEANSTGRLLRGHGVRANWVALPESKIDTWELPLPQEPVPDLEVEMKKHAERASRKQSIPDGFDFTQEVPLQKCETLPMLHSKFSQAPSFFRRLAKDGRVSGGIKSIKQGFNEKSQSGIVQSLRSLWYKPLPETLVHRKLEPRSGSNSSAGSPTSQDWMVMR